MSTVPKGFFPDEDTGFMRGITEAQPDTSFTEMSRRQVAVSQIIQDDPAVAKRDLGGRFRRRDQQGLPLHQAEGQGASAARSIAIMIRLRDATGGDSRHSHDLACRCRISTSPAGASRGRSISTRCSRATSTRSIRKRRRWRRRSRNCRACATSTAICRSSNPQTRVDIDRDKAAAFGITTDQVRTALYNAYGTRQISTIFTEADDYEVILEATREFPERHRGARTHPRRDAGRPARAARRSRDDAAHASARCRSTVSRSSRR